MISVDKLTRCYSDFIAVDEVSFTIGQGEIVGLLGHNGAGKTTIMKILTGFLEPSSGSIDIDGIDPAAEPLKVRQKIGYLPENCPVYPEMSVIDYLDYAGSLHGIRENARAERLRETIERTGLVDKALQPIATLSRGYRQRVGVAQAILHQPKILILDEPTNGLDPTQIQEMRGLIQDLARKATVIISTHILQEVQAVCSRVMIIRSGQKALDSGLDELQSEERLQVTTDCDPKTFSKILSPIATISKISDSGTGKFEIAVKGDTNQQEVAAQVAATLQQADKPLYELAWKKRSIEALFGEISATGGEV